jgi:hypothetical protein
MNVVPGLEACELWECGVMRTPWPLSRNVAEDEWARIEREDWRGWFHHAQGCASGMML